MKNSLNAKLYDEFNLTVFPYATRQDYTPYYITCIKISEDSTECVSQEKCIFERTSDVLVRRKDNSWLKTTMKKKLVWNKQEQKYNQVPAIIELNKQFNILDLKEIN